MGLLDRYTSLIDLPSGWRWLSNGWVLLILVVLLAIEVVADKIPILDHLNDVVAHGDPADRGRDGLRRVVRVADRDGEGPGLVLQSPPVGTDRGRGGDRVDGARGEGDGPAGGERVHAGLRTPIVSTIEDAFSTVLSVVAIVLPVLVVVFIVGFVWFVVWVRRRRRRRKADRAAARATARSGSW